MGVGELGLVGFAEVGGVDLAVWVDFFEHLLEAHRKSSLSVAGIGIVVEAVKSQRRVG